MAGRNVDSAEGPALFVSMTGAPISSVAFGDNQYRKANRKEELKLTKLNTENYQTWAKGMEILLSAKDIWRLVFGIEKMLEAMRPNDRMDWLGDDAQAKAWIYVNLESDQINHVEDAAIANEMWAFLKKIHGAAGRSRLNFLMKRFYSYKAGSDESIDIICSNLARLQKTIREINANVVLRDLNMALTLINAIDNEAYVMAKYQLDDVENLTLEHIKEKLKLVKAKIKDDSASDELVNRAGPSSKGKETRECYHCKKKEHFKTKCFKWLATDDGKKYTEEQAKKTADAIDIKTINQDSNKSASKKSDRSAGNVRTAKERESDDSDTA